MQVVVADRDVSAARRLPVETTAGRRHRSQEPPTRAGRRLRHHRLAAVPLQPRGDARSPRSRGALRRSRRALPRDSPAARAGPRIRAPRRHGDPRHGLGAWHRERARSARGARSRHRPGDPLPGGRRSIGPATATCLHCGSATRPTRCSTSSRCPRPSFARADSRRSHRSIPASALLSAFRLRSERSTSTPPSIPRSRRCRSRSATAASAR